MDANSIHDVIVGTALRREAEVAHTYMIRVHIGIVQGSICDCLDAPSSGSELYPYS